MASLETLPKYMRPLVKPYDFRCYWFETFECLRKLSLTGITIFFAKGSVMQLVVALVLCVFLSWIFHNKKPYRADDDDVLASICQGAVFIVIVARIVIQNREIAENQPPWFWVIEFVASAFMIAPFFAAIPLTFQGVLGSKEGAELRTKRSEIRAKRKAQNAGVAPSKDEEPAVPAPAQEQEIELTIAAEDAKAERDEVMEPIPPPSPAHAPAPSMASVAPYPALALVPAPAPADNTAAAKSPWTFGKGVIAFLSSARLEAPAPAAEPASKKEEAAPPAASPRAESTKTETAAAAEAAGGAPDARPVDKAPTAGEMPTDPTIENVDRRTYMIVDAVDKASIEEVDRRTSRTDAHGETLHA